MLGKLLAGPAGALVEGGIKLFIKITWDGFIKKPEKTLKRLRMAAKVKNKLDVAKAKLSQPDPQEVQTEKLRDIRNKQSEVNVANEMNLEQLTSIANKINNEKAKDVRINSDKFTNYMSNLNKVHSNINLEAKANALNNKQYINNIKVNDIPNEVTSNASIKINNSASTLDNLSANKDTKPIADLGKVLTNQNAIIADSNFNNMNKLGEMIRNSSSMNTENLNEVINAEKSILKVNETQNDVLAGTANVISNINTSIPSSLNDTAVSITEANSKMLEEAANINKEAVLSVGDDLVDKINTLSEAEVKSSALLVRNDNETTEQILEAVDGGNKVVESKLNSVIESHTASSGKLNNILKIGKEALRDWMKDMLTKFFEIVIGIQKIFEDTPLMRKLRKFLDPSFDPNAKDAKKLDENEYNELNKQYSLMLNDPTVSNLELNKMFSKLSEMKARDSKDQANEVNQIKKAEEGNSGSVLEGLRETRWVKSRAKLFNDVVNNLISTEPEDIEKLRKFCSEFSDHRYNAWFYLDVTGKANASDVYNNNAFSKYDNISKMSLVNGAVDASVMDKEWKIPGLLQNYLTLCYSEDGTYNTIHLDDYLLVEANSYIKLDLLKLLGKTYYNMYVTSLDISVLYNVVAGVNNKEKYLKMLRKRSLEPQLKIIDLLEKQCKIATDAKYKDSPFYNFLKSDALELDSYTSFDDSGALINNNELKLEAHKNKLAIVGSTSNWLSEQQGLDDDLIKSNIRAGNANIEFQNVSGDYVDELISDYQDNYKNWKLENSKNHESKLEEYFKKAYGVDISKELISDPNGLIYTGLSKPAEIPEKDWSKLVSSGFVREESYDKLKELIDLSDEGYVDYSKDAKLVEGLVGTKGTYTIANDLLDNISSIEGVSHNEDYRELSSKYQNLTDNNIIPMLSDMMNILTELKGRDQANNIFNTVINEYKKDLPNSDK